MIVGCLKIHEFQQTKNHVFQKKLAHDCWLPKKHTNYNRKKNCVFQEKLAHKFHQTKRPTQSISRCNFCAVESKIAEPNNYGAHNESPKAEIYHIYLGKKKTKKTDLLYVEKALLCSRGVGERGRNMIANKNNRKFEEQALEV